jgi:hypothetical protein
VPPSGRQSGRRPGTPRNDLPDRSNGGNVHTANRHPPGLQLSWVRLTDGLRAALESSQIDRKVRTNLSQLGSQLLVTVSTQEPPFCTASCLLAVSIRASQNRSLCGALNNLLQCRIGGQPVPADALTRPPQSVPAAGCLSEPVHPFCLFLPGWVMGQAYPMPSREGEYDTASPGSDGRQSA